MPRTIPRDILQLKKQKSAANPKPQISVILNILFSINYFVPKILSPASPRPGTI